MVTEPKATVCELVEGRHAAGTIPLNPGSVTDFRSRVRRNRSLGLFVLFDFRDDYVPIGMFVPISTLESAFHVDSIFVGSAKEYL